MDRIDEASFAAALGLKTKDLAGMRVRSLSEHVHWLRDDRRIFYTRAGVSRMNELLGKKEGPPPAQMHTIWTEPDPALIVEKKEGGPLLLKVIGKMPSHKHLKCSDGRCHDLRVEVASNAYFIAGMELLATPVGGTAGKCWKYTGPLPRKMGRW